MFRPNKTHLHSPSFPMYFWNILVLCTEKEWFIFIYLQNTRAVLFRLVEASHMLQCRGIELFLEIFIRPTECDSSLPWTLATAIAQLQVPNLCLMKEAPELLDTKASTIFTSYLRFKECGVLLGYKDRDTGPFFLLIGLLRKGLREGICSQASLMLGLPWWLSSKEYICQCRRCGFDAWVGKIPWGRKWSTHSSILAWEIPWREERHGLQKKKKSRKNSCKRVGHDLVTKQQQTLMFIPPGLHRGASGLGC